MPGTANSDPFAPGKPADARAPTNRFFIRATISTGRNTTNTSVEGSVNITLNSWRTIDKLARRDMLYLLVRFLVPASGEGQVYGLQVRPDDLDRAQPHRGDLRQDR